MRATRFYQMIMAGAIIMLVSMTILTSFSLPGQASAQPLATRRAEIQATFQAESSQAAATFEAEGIKISGTLEAESTRLFSTLQASGQNVAGTIEADAERIAATLQASGENLAGTAQVAGENLAATLEAADENIAATAQYVIDTVAGQSVEAIQATATAILADIEVYLEDLPEEVAQLVEYFLANSSIDYQIEGDTLTVTTFVNETDANLMLDILVQAAGYDPDSVMLDATAEGTILVIVEDASEQLPGTLVMTYSLSVVDGKVVAQLVSVTLNNRPIPLDRVPAELTSATDLGVMAAAMQTIVGVPVPSDYTVQELNVTADGVLISFSVSVTQF